MTVIVRLDGIGADDGRPRGDCECSIRAIFERVSLNRNSGKILWHKFCMCTASCRCACACETLNCTLDGMPYCKYCI